MKTIIKQLTILTLLVAVMTGCSSPAYVQKDESANLNNYKTYMWVNTRASETDESTRPIEYADISVHNAVNEELRNWGWTEVSSDPDVVISYDILVERNVETQREPVYSQPFTRFYYNPYTRRYSRIYYPSQFQGYQVYDQPVKEGTITLSIMDARTDKNVWQAWTTERLSGSRLTEGEIRRSVRNIFKEAS
ncbi:MAG TPA: DUF4136 domain-containing protein [Chitinophagaceae bacterium]|jgi:hypothetical protein|nr:DUF4136 domain-containing protein [Chitinophagaceae bacterium]